MKPTLPAVKVRRSNTQPRTRHSVTLPLEIIFDILLRLPVESLLRCKSVCKKWNSLISKPHFVNKHYTLSCNNPKYMYHKVVFKRDCENTTHGKKVNINTCPLYNMLYDDNDSRRVVYRCYPFELSAKGCLEIVGSCRGLICFYELETPVVYNPSTRVWTRLCNASVEEAYPDMYGFGYDVCSDDFKLVVVSRLMPGNEVKIYSLKTQTWKKIGCYRRDDFPFENKCGVFSNGALYWVVQDSSRQVYAEAVVCLDFENECFRDVVQPVYDNDDDDEGDRILTLGTLGERLCLLCNYTEDRADVWVVMDDSEKDSWTKLFSFRCPENQPWSEGFCFPLWIVNEKKLLVRYGWEWLIYDMQEKSFTSMKFTSDCDLDDFDGYQQSCIIVESLASPCPSVMPKRLRSSRVSDKSQVA